MKAPKLKESLQGVKNQDVPIKDATVPSLLDVASVYQNCGLLERCCKDFVHTLINQAINSAVPVAGTILVPGDVIFREGDSSGASLYIIYRGSVDVLLGDTKVATLSGGSHFGEMQLLGLSKFRTATVIVSEFAQIFEITPTVFSRCIQEFPRERKLFEAIASKRFAELQEARKKKAAEKGITDATTQSPLAQRRSVKVAEVAEGQEDEGPGLVEPVDPATQQSASEARAIRQREMNMFRKLDAIPAVSVAARQVSSATPTCGMRGAFYSWHDEPRQAAEDAEDPPDLVRMPPMDDLCLDQQRWLHGQLLQRAEAHTNAEAMGIAVHGASTPMSATTPRSLGAPRFRSRSTSSTPGPKLYPNSASPGLSSMQRHRIGTPEVQPTGRSRPASASPAVTEMLAAVRRAPRRPKQASPPGAPSSIRRPRIRPQTAPSSFSGRSK